MPTLFLMCGLPGAGKTTRAKQIEHELGAIRFTPDEWIAHLEIDPFDEDRRTVLEGIHIHLALQLLSRGISVILDFGFWSKEERDHARELAALVDAEAEIVFLDASRDELLARLAGRGSGGEPGEVAITEEQLEDYSQMFQPPSQEELASR